MRLKLCKVCSNHLLKHWFFCFMLKSSLNPELTFLKRTFQGKNISDEAISEEDSTKFLQLSWKINFWLQNFIMKLHFICARLQNFWKKRKVKFCNYFAFVLKSRYSFAIFLHLNWEINIQLQFSCTVIQNYSFWIAE